MATVIQPSSHVVTIYHYLIKCNISERTEAFRDMCWLLEIVVTHRHEMVSKNCKQANKQKDGRSRPF